MPIIEQEPEVVQDLETADSEIPPIFGRCPVCKKPLHPRDRYTGEPAAPPIGAGVLSRAKCDRCGAIIEYVGKGDWVVVEGPPILS